MDLTRRRLLATTAGAAATGMLAGCTAGTPDGGGERRDGTTARASFFVFGDLLSAVAGDATRTDLLVPVGQHGHGWEPGPRVREAIRDADLLAHGMVGFQPWLDDIRTDLDADGAAVTTVDVSADLDLLGSGTGHEEAHSGDAHSEEAEHEEATHEGTEHEEEGHSEETDHEETDAGADAHDHGPVDPHFWMDPLRLRTAVGTVERALADVDPDNAPAYAENARRHRERLARLHDDIETTVADADVDTVLVAGHDSFGYLGDRYGVEVAALTGVSPDDRPTPRDIERAQAVVRDHGLRYVCADPLESQRAAEQLVAETDAEAVLPLTAMPGRTTEWAADGWGYVEVMSEVNLPTLARALEAR